MMTRLSLILGWLLLSVQFATALSPVDCTKMANGGDRLGCFDKLFPPEKAKKIAEPKTEYRDITVDEDARLDKAIKSICRDCSK